MTNSPLDWYQHSPTSTVFDEAVDENGQVRPAWASLAHRLAGLGEHGLAERRRRCEHLLAAQGATHVPHRELLGVPAAHSAAWHLDPVPFVISRDEWRTLEGEITERAMVLAAIAADFAGPRRLLAEGVVPAAAIYGEPSFLPLAPSGWVNPMWWYGADLVRTADGRWRVLRDVTDGLQGVGEALLHRSVVSRALGDVNDRPGPAPLTDHLDDFRAVLSRAAPRGRSSPRTVVLTGEAGSVEYLAASHLSSQLGFHRTSSADLVVRDRRVWLRSLGGLEPVDVVLRTVPAADLDPLTNPRRGRGVPGIVHAERSGAVTIVNPVSAALAGSPSMAPHLGAAAFHLVGKLPALEAVPTSWCGDPSVLADVLADPRRWVLQDTTTGQAVFGSTLSDDWTARLRLRPSSLIALGVLDLATVPVVRGARAAPGTVVLGVSALIHDGVVHVMPGGFARVVDPDVPIIGQHSGWAKDVWVYEHRRARAVTIVGPLPQVDLRESLPTQAAEAMFWLGRSAEGAEVQARLIRVVTERLAADPALVGGGDGSWAAAAVAMLRTSRGLTMRSAAETPLAEQVTECVSGPRGLVDRLDHVLGAAASVREFLSTSTGRVLADIGELRRRVRADDAESLERLLVSLAALSGLSQESTVRGPAWRLLDLGRRLERSVAVLGAIEASLGRVPDAEAFQAVGETVLAAHEALIAYRRWHRTDVELDALVDLLVRDDTNPRSVAFQLDRIVEHLASLPAGATERALAQTAAAAAVEPMAADGPGAAERHFGVGALVLAVRGPLLQLGERLVHEWFSDPIAPRPMGDSDVELS